MAKIETDISVGKARVAVETVLVSLFRGLSWTLTLKGTQLYDSELVSDMLQVQRPVSSFFKSLTSMTHASSSFRYILPTPFLPFLHWWAPLFHFVLQDFPLLSCMNSHVYHSRSGRHESFIVSPSIIDTIASFGSYSLILKAREVANKTRRMDFILSRSSSLTLKSLIVHRNIFVLSSCNGKIYKLPLIRVLPKEKIKTLSFDIKNHIYFACFSSCLFRLDLLAVLYPQVPHSCLRRLGSCVAMCLSSNVFRWNLLLQSRNGHL